MNVLAAAAVALAVALVPVPVDRMAFPPGGDRLDAALDGDRTLLSFLPDDVRGGRFAFRVERDGHGFVPARHWRGVFWRTSSGNAYTRADPYDTALVRREVGALAEHVRRDLAEERAEAAARGSDGDTDDMDVTRMLPLTTGTFYEGAEFQWPLWEVVEPLLVWDPDLVVLAAVRTCGPVIDAYRVAVRDAVRALVPDFRPSGGRERWVIDLAALRLATRGPLKHAEDVCGIEQHGPDPLYTTFTVERWRTGVALRPAKGDGTYGPATVVDVTPGPPGLPPLAPDPAPAGGVVNDFLLAVAECGALPWEFMKWAAADSYHPPYTEYYQGPTVFWSDWVCADDVPARANVQT